MGRNFLPMFRYYSSVIMCLIASSQEISVAANIQSFCSSNLFKNNDTWLQFTKEINTIDYVTLEHFKSLSCCAKGYTSIQWMKNGREISFNSDFPTFKYLEDGNQTLVSKEVRYSDAGNYTCIIRNATNEINHTIYLTVKPNVNYTGPALLTYPSPATIDNIKINHYHMNVYAEVGDSKRILCEGYVGAGNELMSQVEWVFENMTFVSNSTGHICITGISRDKSMIQGQYLYFETIKMDDFTNYLCSISNGHNTVVLNATLIRGFDPANIRMVSKPIVIIFVVVLVIMGLILLVLKRWHLEIELFWKDHFGKIEDGNKKYDAFICYDDSDSDFAEVLVETLEKVYQYKCFEYYRDGKAGESKIDIYSREIKKCKRFIVVLSKTSALNGWFTFALSLAIEELSNLRTKIICIELEEIPWKDLEKNVNVATDTTLQQMPEDENSSSYELQQPVIKTTDHTLQQVLKVICKVRWESAKSKQSCPAIFKLLTFTNRRSETKSKAPLVHKDIDSGSERFWTALRCHLPPKQY